MTVTPATEYVDRARKLGPELEAAAEEIERRRELPEPIVEALIDRGLFRLLLPHALGGAELPPAAYVQVIEEIAKLDASAAWCLGQANGCTMTAALLDPEVAREIFGSRRGISLRHQTLTLLLPPDVQLGFVSEDWTRFVLT